MTDQKAFDFALRSARLSEAAILGDPEAFGQLLRLWHPRWLAFARRKAGSDADDILQMASLTIAQNIENLRDPKRFGPWSMTIIARRHADFIDQAVRERRTRDALSMEPPSSSPDTQTTLAVRDALRKALSRLPAEQRTLLTLQYVDGLTGDEISSLLGLPLGTVKSRLHTSRARLREAYTIQKGDENG